MNKGDFQNILLDDWRQKKKFNAHFRVGCEICGYDIDEDDEFIFFGNSQKLCKECFDEVKNFLEEL